MDRWPDHAISGIYISISHKHVPLPLAGGVPPFSVGQPNKYPACDRFPSNQSPGTEPAFSYSVLSGTSTSVVVVKVIHRSMCRGNIAANLASLPYRVHACMYVPSYLTVIDRLSYAHRIDHAAPSWFFGFSPNTLGEEGPDSCMQLSLQELPPLRRASRVGQTNMLITIIHCMPHAFMRDDAGPCSVAVLDASLFHICMMHDPVNEKKKDLPPLLAPIKNGKA